LWRHSPAKLFFSFPLCIRFEIDRDPIRPNMAAVLLDENQPLLGADNDRSRPQDEAEEELDIDFDPSGDPDNPLEWPATFKWTIVALLALMAFTV
jgi:hypothetical protein